MVNNKLLNTVGKNNIGKNDEIINIITIIFGALLVIAIILAIVFLIINLLKKQKHKDLLIYDQFNNKLAYFSKSSCKKVKYEVGDKILITNNENVPIYFYLTSNMVSELNKYCKSKLNNDPFSNKELFYNKEQKLIVTDPISRNIILESFESSNLVLNPIHPYIYGYKPINLFKKFSKLSFPKDYKLIKFRNKYLLYVNFIQLLKLNGNTEYSKFEIAVPDKYTRTFKPIILENLKRKYYEWYHYLENNFSNVYCTLRYNRENSVNNEIIFKDEKEFKERINKITTPIPRSKIFNFNRYTIHFDKQSNSKKNLYKLFDKSQNLLKLFLDDLQKEDSIDSEFIDNFRIISKYSATVKSLSKIGNAEDDIDIIFNLQKTLVNPDQLDVFMNTLEVPLGISKTQSKKYYRLIPDDTNTNNMTLNIYGNNVNFNNYFMNNLKFMSDYTFDDKLSNLTQVIMGSVDEPINFKKLMCFNIKSFMKKDNKFVKFDINIGEVYEHLKLHNILEDEEDAEVIKLNKNVIKNNFSGSNIVFHNADYTFMRNILNDIKTYKYPKSIEFVLDLFLKLERDMKHNLFTKAQCDLKPEELFNTFNQNHVHTKERHEALVGGSSSGSSSGSTSSPGSSSGSGSSREENFEVKNHYINVFKGCYIKQTKIKNGSPIFKNNNNKFLWRTKYSGSYYWCLGNTDSDYFGGYQHRTTNPNNGLVYLLNQTYWYNKSGTALPKDTILIQKGCL